MRFDGSLLKALGAPRVDILLVTSGLGSQMGGIGRLSESMLHALERTWRMDVVTATPIASRAMRAARLGSALVASALKRPRLVLYEHRGLATAHAFIPLLRSVPYAIFLHGYEVWQPLAAGRRRVIENATCLLANSMTTVVEARKANPWLPNPRVVHLGVDVAVLVARAPEPSPILVLLGRVDAGERFKGHDEILDAWPAIRAELPDARFVAIGGGTDLPRMRQRIAAEKLEGVEFTGFVSAEVRDTWLRKASAAFALGRVEGFGLANVEAAALGIPLIGLSGTVLEELFPPGVGVTFVESLNRAHLAETTVTLLKNAAQAAELGRRGREHVLLHYTTAHFEKRLADVIDAFITGRERPTGERTDVRTAGHLNKEETKP